MTERTSFITGVSSRLGRQLAEHLLADGERVAGTARRMTPLGDLVAAYPESFWLDVTDTPAIRRVADAAFAHFGRIEQIAALEAQEAFTRSTAFAPV